MAVLARIALDDGGFVLLEADPGFHQPDGPVQAGRVTDAIHELPAALSSALLPVTDTARTVLRQLRAAGPDEVEVEFGVDLAVEAGAVITKTAAQGHLRVRVLWRNSDTENEQ